MKVQGYEVSEAVLTRVEDWMRHSASGFTANSLEGECIKAGVPDGAVSMRMADRLIQKHRKSGNIVIRSHQGERARWEWK